ncbi:major facilitator superfamily domain-containing protein [Podospora appendiculata]|uniref:Major facilitator superfamily domain-containing protein n=1 Tax=Podospora appendiculata TaxID=314037 RepID=A0AAE0XMY6_9PEZI|nr:major facilitator superfamily domain-containing protein [Podospora appendiculata]
MANPDPTLGSRPDTDFKAAPDSVTQQQQPTTYEPEVTEKSNDSAPSVTQGQVDTVGTGSSGDGSGSETDGHLPLGPKLIGIIVSLMLGVFCVALDNTIIAVAIPKITDDFHALNDVGWYGSAYLLTTCSFQLFFGKLYALFNIKLVLLSALFVFEVGSLVCAVAPSSIVLIVGRAIAGLGGSGIFSGALVTIAHIVPLRNRPVIFGGIGGVYGVASVAGPLMGGAFTDKLSWRWCFYINLPIGGATAVGIILLLKLQPRKKSESTDATSWMRFARSLDPVGTVLLVSSIICLVLVLSWGGVDYPWSNARIVALFVVFGIALLGFCWLQVALNGDDATVPLRVASQRSVAASSLFGLCVGGSFFVFVFFIPIWAIKGTSAVMAGVYSLPLILAEVVAIVISGGLVTAFGYFAPYFIACSVVSSVGAGLTLLLTPDSSQAEWAGYTFLYGFGIGLGFQQGGVAAQAVLPFADVSVGTAVVLFVQILGGAVFVSVAQNTFANRLLENILALGIPNLDVSAVIRAGATGIRNVVDAGHLPAVLVAYNDALLQAFQVGLILSVLSILGAVGVEWRSVKGKNMPGAGAA